MTTELTEECRCAICGKVSLQGIIASTSAFGSPDLDFRPPPMERETIDHWVQECPHCGYCAPELDQSIAGAAAVIASEEYGMIRKRRGDLPLFGRFLCASFLFEQAGCLVEAAATALYAAWAADDADDAEEEAVRARQRVLALIDELHARGEQYGDDPATEALLMVDVSRRSGAFDRARQLIAELAGVEDPLFQALVAFQREKVEAGDMQRYTVEQAIFDPTG